MSKKKVKIIIIQNKLKKKFKKKREEGVPRKITFL